jgi:hypothetical protein
MDRRALVPCLGGPCEGYGVLVDQPLPLEVERGVDGIYVLDEEGDRAMPGPRYVYVEHA